MKAKVLALALSFAGLPAIADQVIHFPSGAYSYTTTGSVADGKHVRYTLDVAEGQYLVVNVTSRTKGFTPSFCLRFPDGRDNGCPNPSPFYHMGKGGNLAIDIATNSMASESPGGQYSLEIIALPDKFPEQAMSF